MKKIKTFDAFFWWSAAAFLLVVAIICFFPAWFTSSFSKYNFTTTGQIGDTIGGIMGPFVAIAAAALTFLAFWVQYKANEQQKEDIKELKERAEKERFETIFFEMVKFHRDNVSELSYSYYDVNSSTITEDSPKQTALSRKVFKVIYIDFVTLKEELDFYFNNKTEEDIYEDTYLLKLKSNPTITERRINLVDYAQVDIVYCILYFGLNSDEQETIKNIFNNRYKKDFFKDLLFLAALKPARESLLWNKRKIYNSHTPEIKKEFLKKLINDWAKNLTSPDFMNEPDWRYLNFKRYEDIYYFEPFKRYYRGHQTRLSNYFRNLFLVVTYVNDNLKINYDQQYSNIKLLRSQLSAYEQSILFINSLSILGRAWEFDSVIKSGKIIENFQLITKYNLIKNILSENIAKTIKVSDFYPRVSYEGNVNKITEEKRNKLIKDCYNSKNE